MSNYKEKYECQLCGVYYWVVDRDDFDCPNCEASEIKANVNTE